MKFILDRYFEKTHGFYPFFKYCPCPARDYYLTKRASKALGYEYNWKNPKTLNEKIRWLIFNEKPELKSRLTDKILVKSYAAQKLGKNHSAELYGTYRNFDEIDFSVLPERFALKANHGWRMNILVKDKKFIYDNKNEVRKITARWLKTDYSLFSLEPQYKNIKRKLLIESLRKEDSLRCDVQVHCFNFEPLFIELPINIDGKRYYQFYDLDWKLQDFTYKSSLYKEPIPRPELLDLIIIYSRLLAKEFTYVRCDFAIDNNNIELVEMTFTPCSAIIPFSDKEIDSELGSRLILPQEAYSHAR